MKILGRCSVTAYSVPPEKEDLVKGAFSLNVWKKINQLEFDKIVSMCKNDAPPVLSAPAPSIVASEKLQKPSEVLAEMEEPKVEEVVEEIIEAPKIEEVVEEPKLEEVPIEVPKVEEVIVEPKVEELEVKEEKKIDKIKEEGKTPEEKLGVIEKATKKFRKKNGKK
jgi:hypothetical protein